MTEASVVAVGTPQSFRQQIARALAGYTLAAWFLRVRYKRPDRSAWRVGGVRTLIGIGVGAAYFGMHLAVASFTNDADETVYMLGLVPGAHYCRLVASDRNYVDESVATLRHPQVMLAWLMNDAPIPPRHGAPLRLIVPFPPLASAATAATAGIR